VSSIGGGMRYGVNGGGVKERDAEEKDSGMWRCEG
jgi:hypothetical protein